MELQKALNYFSFQTRQYLSAFLFISNIRWKEKHADDSIYLFCKKKENNRYKVPFWEFCFLGLVSFLSLQSPGKN